MVQDRSVTAEWKTASDHKPEPHAGNRRRTIIGQDSEFQKNFDTL